MPSAVWKTPTAKLHVGSRTNGSGEASTLLSVWPETDGSTCIQPATMKRFAQSVYLPSSLPKKAGLPSPMPHGTSCFQKQPPQKQPIDNKKGNLHYNSLKKAKDSGMIIYGEATPHHLFLNIEDVNKNDKNKMLLRMKPELREKKDNEALWKAILDGTIDTIGTDHAPHLISEKMEKLTFGIPSVEHSLELMLNKINDGTIDLKLLTKIMSENASKIFGIKNKGILKENYDADLVIIDMKDNFKIEEKDIITKAGWSPYIDFNRGGKVLTTIVRGNKVYNNGIFTDMFIGKEIIYN